MRGPPPRLPFTVCAIASLALCVAACTFWVRNLRVTDRYTFDVLDDQGRWVRRLSVTSWWGSLVLEDAEPDVAVARPEPGLSVVRHTSWPGDPQTPPVDPTQVGLTMGFGAGAFRFVIRPDVGGRTVPTVGGTARVLLVPWYAVILLTIVPPLLWFRSVYRTGRRQRLGQCLHCGYDLRATPGRCPECGTTPRAEGA